MVWGPGEPPGPLAKKLQHSSAPSLTLTIHEPVQIVPLQELSNLSFTAFAKLHTVRLYIYE